MNNWKFGWHIIHNDGVNPIEKFALFDRFESPIEAIRASIHEDDMNCWLIYNWKIKIEFCYMGIKMASATNPNNKYESFVATPAFCLCDSKEFKRYGYVVVGRDVEVVSSAVDGFDATYSHINQKHTRKEKARTQ